MYILIVCENYDNYRCNFICYKYDNYMQQMHIVNAYDNYNVKLYIKNGNDIV